MTRARNKAAAPKPSAPTPKRPLTPEEIAEGDAYFKKLKDGTPTLKPPKAPSGQVRLETQDDDHPMPADIRLARVVGSVHPTFQNYILNQIFDTFPGYRVATDQGDTEIDEETMVAAGNTVMAVLNAVRPRDELEAMLAAQMIGVHNLAMQCQKAALSPGQTFDGKFSNIGAATKLMRTFQSQLETLQRYRNGVHQTVEVKHVHVESEPTAAQLSREQETPIQPPVSESISDGKQSQEDHPPAERQSAGQSDERAPVRSQNTPGQSLPGRRNGKRPLSHARRKEHWAPHPGRSGAMPSGKP